MTIFYLIFILLAVYYCFRYDGIEEYDSHKQHRLWLMCGYLICLTGFSYGLGGDKFTYMEQFENYPSTLEDTKLFIMKGMLLGMQMPLWTIINMVCKFLFNSFYAVQLAESFVINVAVCFAISRYTHRYFLTLLLYFLSLQYFIFNTEIMREGFALGLSLIGMHFWIKKRRWMFAVMICLAVTAHVSAVIAFLFPFARFKASWKTLAVAVMVSLLLWAVSDEIMGRAYGLLAGTGTLAVKAMYYSLQTSSALAVLVHDLRFLILPFIMMYSSVQMESSEQLRKYKEHFLAYFTILAVIVSAIPGLIRFYNYAYIYYFIMTAEFIYTLFRYREHIIPKVGTLAVSIFFVIQFYRGYYESSNSYFYEFYYPYTCILNEDADVSFRIVAHGEAIAQQIRDKNIRDIE